MGGKIMAVLVALALVWAVPGVSDAEPSGSGPPPELLRVLPITGGHTVPDDAEMVAVNITAVAPDCGRPCDRLFVRRAAADRLQPQLRPR